VTLFWKAYDYWQYDLKADPAKLAETLQKQYLDSGSQGVKDFIPRRIVSAQHLAEQILQARAYYESTRSNDQRIHNALPEIRRDFAKLKSCILTPCFRLCISLSERSAPAAPAPSTG
jgi:hypothetical protein